MHSVDGRQLAFPGTGLAIVTSELLAALPRIAGEEIAVFVPPGWPAGDVALPASGLRVIEVAHHARRPDYADRIAWSKAVQQARRNARITGRHFIPYLYNYGSLRDNVVMIPDLVYREYPDYGMRDASRPWWSPRGRLPLRPMVRRWEESRVSRSERIVVISEFVRRQVHALLGVPMERMSVLALAAPAWTDASATDAPVPVLDGIGGPFALYTGGYAVRKNVPMLLRACGRVFERDRSFRCVFIGLTDDIVRRDAAIREALDAVPVQQAIVRTGPVATPVIAAAYRRCAFVVYPSQSEGFGLPVVEASACGKVCLCGDNSSMRDIEPRSAFRIASDDEDRWCERMLDLWQHPDECRRAGAQPVASARRSRWDESARTIWRLLSE